MSSISGKVKIAMDTREKTIRVEHTPGPDLTTHYAQTFTIEEAKWIVKEMGDLVKLIDLQPTYTREVKF